MGTQRFSTEEQFEQNLQDALVASRLSLTDFYWSAFAYTSVPDEEVRRHISVHLTAVADGKRIEPPGEIYAHVEKVLREKQHNHTTQAK